MSRIQLDRMLYMKSIRWCGVVWLSLLLGACDGDNLSDLKVYVSEIKAQQKSAIEPLPEIQPAETFIFNPEGLRDPFAATVTLDEKVESVAGNGIMPNSLRRKEELESYALDSLRMVGTLKMQSSLWGLVRANDGTIHRVRTSNYLGQNHGKIIRVLEDRIELMEIIPDGPGNWRERPASLALAE